MPFTFAHIGYVLPIKKKWTSQLHISGLIFGSIAPDYDILFRFTENRHHIFQYDLFCVLGMIFPLALVSLIAFHLYCQKILLKMLPLNFQSYLTPFLSIELKNELKINGIKIAISILIAIYLHLLLDVLGHLFDAYSIKMFFLFLTNSDSIAVSSYYAAIYFPPLLLSFIGFYFIIIYLPLPLRNTSSFQLNTQQLKFWMLLFALTCFYSMIKYFYTMKETDFAIDFIVITFTSSFMLAFFSICLFYHFILKEDAQ